MGRRRKHPDHRQRDQVDDEIKWQAGRAGLPERPNDPDRGCHRIAAGTVMPSRTQRVMPGEAEFIDLAEVDDLDVGKNAATLALSV